MPPATNSREKSKNFSTGFGERFRFLREKLGLNQSELAAKLGYATYQAIGRFERGERLPSVEALFQFVNLGNFNLHWLITGKMSPDGEFWRSNYSQLLRIYHEDTGLYLDQLNREIKDFKAKIVPLTHSESSGGRDNRGLIGRHEEEIVARQVKIDKIEEHTKQAFDRIGGNPPERS